MSHPSRNTRMFALPASPPGKLTAAGTAYRLVRVFKHDFWAATCLYERCDETTKNTLCDLCVSVVNSSEVLFPKIVVKFSRARDFVGLPLAWTGKRLADHEEAIYTALKGLAGVPRWVARLSPTCYAIEYVEATPLDHWAKIPPGFFGRLRNVFDEIHARGVAYGDANKKSNILVTADGRPVLIDFQISLRRRDDWPRPMRNVMRRVVTYLQGKDLYHLYKHKRRLAPEELTEEENALSRKRGGLHALHRKLTKPYRSLRRGFLQRQHIQGRLQSPTADLEDHHQPEKATWRNS
ncbi:MAG: hypothetical protein JW849_01305 [Phycisphaerae bacterium]|nr:hypothetical protein [Phycisphaerae bacterium]